MMKANDDALPGAVDQSSNVRRIAVADQKVSAEERERFRRYMEQRGVADFVTKELAILEGFDPLDMPSNAIRFLQERMIAQQNNPVVLEYRILTSEKNELLDEIHVLEKEITDLKKQAC